MDPSTISTLATILSASGPYGLVVVLSWAIWKVMERKDRELKVLSQKIVTIVEAQTAAFTKVEAALVALRSAIERLKNES